MLSQRQQVARMRQLAVLALKEYPLKDPALRFVAHGENTTFRVDAHSLEGRDRYLLRVHRPARHGRNADSGAAVGSELEWLKALRADTDVQVPEPVRTTAGKLAVTASSRATPQTAGVLGAALGGGPQAGRRGAARAPAQTRQCHGPAAQSRGSVARPAGFVRIRWDWESFFGDTMVYGGINAADVWSLLPDDLRRRFDRVASRMTRV